jgi:hypothetical protein
MTIGEWLLLALRVISRRYSTSVAFGPKRTLSHATEAGFMSTRPNPFQFRSHILFPQYSFEPHYSCLALYLSNLID